MYTERNNNMDLAMLFERILPHNTLIFIQKKERIYININITYINYKKYIDYIGDRMDTRKVQLTGGSTLMVSLPKKWVKASGIKNSDSIGFTQQSDGSMLLTPKIGEKKASRRKVVNVEGIESEHLLRKMISIYMVGYNVIELTADRRMSPGIRETIRRFSRIIIGPEIIEETTNSVILHDLIEPADLPLNKGIRRMYLITKSMHNDAIAALKENNIALAEDVIARDNEVNRLYWLVLKQYNLLLTNPSFYSEIGTTPTEGLAYLLIARIIERIADHSGKIAESVKHLREEKINKKIMGDVFAASRIALDIVETSVSAFYTKDISECNKAIDSSEDLVKIREKLMRKVAGAKSTVAVPLAYIIESIDRTGFYGTDIAEIAINHIVGTEE